MPSGPTTGNSSFFTACDAGKWRVPSPAMGMTALRTFILDVEPLPAVRAEGITLGAEFNRAGRHALKNVRHHTDAPGKFDGDLRNVFLQRADFAEHGHGAAGAAAGDFGAVEAVFRTTLADGLDEKIHF